MVESRIVEHLGFTLAPPQPKVFVISLLASKARRVSVANNLNNMGISWEFVDAVDGRNGLPSKYEHLIDRESARANIGRDMLDAEIACAVSHYHAWKKIIEKQLPWALILEDDAKLSGDTVRYLKEAHYTDAAMTFLFCMNGWGKKRSRKHLFKNYFSYQLGPNGSCASAYLMSNYAAWHFCQNAIPFRSTVDWPRCIKKIKCNAIYPFLTTFHSEANLSTIANAETRRLKYSRLRFFFWKKRRSCVRAWRRLSMVHII